LYYRYYCLWEYAMAGILEFCTSGYRGLILVALVGFLALLFQVMLVTTALRWLIRFVKDAWG